jgi:proton glutamate symport protein
MSLGNRAILGLVTGLTAGAFLAAANSPTWLAVGSAVELLGRLWINAILMTIVPLVVSKLFVSIAGSGDARAIGQAGVRAGALFALLLGGGAALAALLTPALFAPLPIDPATSAALRASAAASSAGRDAPLTAAQFVLGLVPTNPIRVAAEGSMLPLIVFSVLFALAAARVAEPLRETLVRFFSAVDATISVLLQWIVTLSPYGVFALALGLAIQVGASIVSALGYYIAVTSLTLVAFTLALYAVVALGARVSPQRFARAVAPAQVVALSTHSSAASLPAMLEGAEKHLQLPRTATGFLLPLSLAVFKYSSPIWFLLVVSFVARLYDLTIDPSRIVPIALVAVATSFAVGGVPSGAAVVVAPVLVTAGLPVEALGLLLAVDPIPNGFRTVANVTGMMAVAVLAAGEPARGSTPAGGEAAARPASAADPPRARPS